jgi:DNA-binding NarL/FixJ family response regulator
MSVLLVSPDLALLSKVAAAADHLHVPLQAVTRIETILDSAQDHPTKAVILDLSAPGLDLGRVIAHFRATVPSAVILAFGPHVHQALLTRAQEAGCDEVFTRGQFHARLDEIIGRYA